MWNFACHSSVGSSAKLLAHSTRGFTPDTELRLVEPLKGAFEK